MGIETAAADRLPWLADEPAPRVAKQRRKSLLPWAASAIVLVAAGGFWLGSRSVEQSVVPATQSVPPTAIVQLPPANEAEAPVVTMAAPKEVQPASASEVRPAPAREVRIAPPAQSEANAQATTAGPAQDSTTPSEVVATAAVPVPAKIAPAAAVAFVMPKPWNPRVFPGAAGRLVQVGAFGTITQAKHGWWYMVRAYPGMSRLPAVVRPTRNSRGRVFYRFQVGTTSQAHSEILCQRMERIRFSCAVVGLPWKAKVER